MSMKKIIIILVCLSLLTGMRACSQYPSTFFSGLDGNNDEKLSYQEWMNYYALPMHHHSIEHCSRRDFYFADCDSDDYLTWKEYYNFRFKHEACESSAVMTLRQKYELDPDLQKNPNRATFENLISIQANELIERELQLKQRYNLINK